MTLEPGACGPRVLSPNFPSTFDGGTAAGIGRFNLPWSSATAAPMWTYTATWVAFVPLPRVSLSARIVLRNLRIRSVDAAAFVPATHRSGGRTLTIDWRSNGRVEWPFRSRPASSACRSRLPRRPSRKRGRRPSAQPKPRPRCPAASPARRGRRTRQPCRVARIAHLPADPANSGNPMLPPRQRIGTVEKSGPTLRVPTPQPLSQYDALLCQFVT